MSPRTLFKGDENARLSVVARAVDQERRRKKRLAATGGSADQRRTAGRDAAKRQVIEAVNTGRAF